MVEIDAFGPEWEHTGPELIPLARIGSCDVVPMSIGTVAMLIIAKHHSASEGDAELKTQIVMGPGAARMIAARLIEAADMVSPAN